MKLGVITDGISRDFEHTLKVMTATGLKYAELQYLWDKEVGDHTLEEIQRIRDLVVQSQISISCISRHNFGGLDVMKTELEDAIYKAHLNGLKQCMHVAKELGTNTVEL